MTGSSIRIGIDLGGTKTEIIALDPSGMELLRRRVPTPREDYPAILATIVALIREAEQALRSRATVGIGTPGSVSRATGLLRGSNSVCLNGQPLQHDLEALLERRIVLTNDANCFALSEASDGAGAAAEVVFGVILGSGVGGGIVVRGHLLDGPNGIAGEWGHNPLPWPREDERPGPPCFCGRTGCIETFVSGRGMERDHREQTGEALLGPEIVARAEAGDASCEATLARYEERLGRALAHIMNVLDPDVIVLGGGMSNVMRLYRNVPPRLHPWVFSDRIDTKIVPHRHGDSSGVRGAAWLGGSVET
ncbi:MAG TPA: ROK family protein [Casimicrobiaceae bacterium]|nr:ROK family protein [Casimicrobiaceae bacterium]